MCRRLVYWLIRHKLKLKNYEVFKFANQRRGNYDVYFFAKDMGLVKYNEKDGYSASGVALNFILDKDCEIYKLGVWKNGVFESV